MEPQDADVYHRSLEAVHAMAYFVPETYQYLEEAGLKPGMMPYFASRAAPMGPVAPAVVTATFFNFNARMIVKSIPLAWSLVPPEQIVELRFKAAGDALRRLLGDLATSHEVEEAAALAVAATEACEAAGRPLFAAHAALEWPDEPLTRLWHAAGLLREHRGDGHVAALVRAGLSGVDALVTHTATGTGFLPQAAQFTRGWRPEEWAAAEADLVERGLLDGDRKLTGAGESIRLQVELDTNLSALAPWESIGTENAQRLAEIGRSLSAAIIASGAIADGIFSDLNRYARR